MKTVDILRDICNAPGVSGAEGATAKVIEGYMRRFTDDIRYTALGDLVCTVCPGRKKKIMLIAHMDKIGLAVTGIDKKSGFLRVGKCGGVDIRTFGAARVKVYGKKTLDGVMISTPPHLAPKASANKADPIDKAAIDCGLPYDEIKDIVCIGDRAELRLPFTELASGKVTSPFIDNSAGCTAVIKAIEKITANDTGEYTVYAVFSTREEVGKQGASTAAFALDADEAIVTDVSFAVSNGVNEPDGAKQGCGAMIACSPILQKSMTERLKKAAEENSVPYTVEVLGRHTGTDADVVVLAKEGITTGLVSIPLKNMHTPAEMVCIKDIDAVAAVMSAAVCTKA